MKSSVSFLSTIFVITNSLFLYDQHKGAGVVVAFSSRSSSSSSSSSKTSTTPFWHDAERMRQRFLVKEQHKEKEQQQQRSTSLQPPRKLLQKIQEAPFRGGLEPVDATKGIPWQVCQVIEGEIPKELYGGILCRNGPGRIRLPVYKQNNEGNNNDNNKQNDDNDDEEEEEVAQYGHWFDGDGFVTKLAFHQNGTATFGGRYVETERFVAQQKHQQEHLSSSNKNNNNRGFAKAGAWTQRKQGKWWQNLFQIPTNPANTNVIFMRNKNGSPCCYAIAEGGHPVPMDLETLQTLGPGTPWTSADGTAVSESFFSAHYSRDVHTNEIYNHGVVLGGSGTKLNVLKYDPDGNLLAQKAHALPHLTFIHDNALSENYLVIMVQPFAVPSTAMLDLLLGKEALGKQFQWDTEAYGTDSEIWIFDKGTLDCVAKVPVGPISTYHLIDAFEDDSSSEGRKQQLTLRLLVHDPSSQRNLLETCFQDLYSARQVPACQLHEIVVGVAAQQTIQNRRIVPDALPAELCDVNAMYPSYRKRYVYLNTRLPDGDFLDSLQKVDLQTGKVSQRVWWGNYTFAGAPIFIPNPVATAENEDDGYVCTQVYRAHDHQSDICILDAKTMRQVARLRIDSHIPYQFHGGWLSAES